MRHQHYKHYTNLICLTLFAAYQGKQSNVNYPTIVSLLSVSEVSEMRVKWSDDVFKDDVGYPHSFHEILLDNDKSIKIYSDYFEIVLLLSSAPEIILEDISEPSEENGVTDIGGSVFVGIEEIIKLKI